ncbi:hypothetical protein GCM10027065_21910 [Rhodanobacter koreensis]
MINSPIASKALSRNLIGIAQVEKFSEQVEKFSEKAGRAGLCSVPSDALKSRKV